MLSWSDRESVSFPWEKHMPPYINGNIFKR